MSKEGAKRTRLFPTRQVKKEMFDEGHRCASCKNDNIHKFSIRRYASDTNAWTITCLECGKKTHRRRYV
jgi:hypothetical protein